MTAGLVQGRLNGPAGWRANPALLGVGYIIGTRISCIMVAGGVLWPVSCWCP